MNRHIIASIVVLLISSPAVAQDESAPTAEQQAPVAESEAPAGDATDSELEGRLEAQQRQIDQLAEGLSEANARIDELEQAELESLEMDQSIRSQRLLEIYGFFDLVFHKFFAEEGGLFDGMLKDHMTFMVPRLNLYFSSQMTETLSALVELRFTFLPHGEEVMYGAPDYGIEYERTDTTVTDPYTGGQYQLGGVAIERVQLTWKPYDFFGVTAGRYLTPYGIWNVDHGSPVLIPARLPLMQIRQAVPSAQTGLQIFGRFFPARDTYLDYAVTLSNGRGPIESVVDLDDNKGAGLRLRLSYEGDEVGFALGGYGYFGSYTDEERNIVTTTPFDVEAEVVERYKEFIGTGDVLLDLYGLRLQGEYVRRLVRYTERPLQVPPDPPGYPADYIAQYVYGLLAYELPIAEYLGGLRVTPYVMYEYAVPDDTSDVWGHTVAAGLNLKPSSFVVIKAEYFTSIFPESKKVMRDDGTIDKQAERFWGLTAQLAVSF